MEPENSQPEKPSFFSNLSWQTALICAVISLVAGGGAGGGIVASKGVKVEGLNQSEADLRYVTKEDAAKISAKRDAQFDRFEMKLDEMNRKLDDKFVRKDIYDQDRENSKALLNQILENVKELKGYKSY